VLGGAQSLHTNSRDEALALPTEESARIALRTQQIIAHETGVTNTADPVGGSEHIESLTDAIEAGVHQYLKQIEEAGGTLRAIETGYIQNQIQNAAYDYQRQIESGERVIVGVNRFQKEDERSAATFKLDPALERAQIESLRQVRTGRSASQVAEKISALDRAARGSDNLMPAILEAAEAYVTVGEISDCLRAVFGEHRDA
jgi:methylmalonyl-CoA mutase N-terminal domain/subunit